MQHIILSILTTTAVLMHSVLGCCWHHAHGCETSQASTAGVPAAAPAHQHTCPGHQHVHQKPDPADSKSSDVPCHGHESCQDAGCSSIAVIPADMKLQFDFAMGVVIDAVDAAVGRCDSRFTGALVAAAAWQRSHEPLRALTQTWLL